jgi:hypothetical protein
MAKCTTITSNLMEMGDDEDKNFALFCAFQALENFHSKENRLPYSYHQVN